MPPVFDSHRSLYLAGTIPIPNPAPTVGRITRKQIWPLGGDTRGTVVLQIEHVQSNRLMIARSVPVDEIRAVYVALDHSNPPEMRDRWFCSSEHVADFLSSLESLKVGALAGVVYVRENASVLMNVVVSMTAAESAEYYPPVIRDRNDGHYALYGNGSHAPHEGGPLGDCQCHD